MRYESVYRSFNPLVWPLVMEHSKRCFFFFCFSPSSIFIQQGYCFVITQKRRMTGDVIFTISLQFLHMKAIDFPPSRPQKKLRSPAAQPSIEWLMKKTIGCIIEYCDWSLLNSLCITLRHTELITMHGLFCVKQTELFFWERRWILCCELGFIVKMSWHRHNICKFKGREVFVCLFLEPCPIGLAHVLHWSLD